MATADDDPKIVQLIVNGLTGKLNRPDFWVRPEESLEQVFRSVELQSRCDVNLYYEGDTIKRCQTALELGMTGKVCLVVEKLGDASHYHHSLELETNCPWCCERYSDEPGHAPVQTACGHWLCIGCYEPHARRCRDLKKGISCLLHPDRYVGLWYEKRIATWAKKNLPFLSRVAVKCSAKGCEENAVWMCMDCDRLGFGAQCEEHCKQAHSMFMGANHKPAAICDSNGIGGSGLCQEHGKHQSFAIENEAADGSVTYKMCCLECFTSDESVKFSGKNVDKLAKRLKEAMEKPEFSDRFKSGIDLCLELENRFKEVVGDGEKPGSIGETVQRVRRFYAELKAQLDENCRAVEAQVEEEAEKRIKALHRLHRRSVESTSRAHHAMAVFQSVAAKDKVPPHAVIWCYNQLENAKRGNIGLMSEAPPERD